MSLVTLADYKLNLKIAAKKKELIQFWAAVSYRSKVRFWLVRNNYFLLRFRYQMSIHQ